MNCRVRGMVVGDQSKSKGRFKVNGVLMRVFSVRLENSGKCT